VADEEIEVIANFLFPSHTLQQLLRPDFCRLIILIWFIFFFLNSKMQ